MAKMLIVYQDPVTGRKQASVKEKKLSTELSKNM